jgi:orotidine-5'-phosphate decarboxylase
MTFGDRLAAAVSAKGSVVCVGLDPRPGLLPPDVAAGLRADRAGLARAYERFCLGAVEAVAPHAVAVKPQVAFFEALGGHGLGALERVCAAARGAGLLVIADAKRGDIDSTAAAYAEAWLRPRGDAPAVADALTVHPYLGGDSLAPFLSACGEVGAGIFVLVKTTNAGGGDLQDLALEGGERLWERVARLVAAWGEPLRGASGLSAVGAVVGATHPEALARARELMPDTPLLLPGVGAQGGDPGALGAAHGRGPGGALVSASRSVLFAWRSQPGDWRDAIAAAAAALKESSAPAAAAGARP